MVTPCTSAEMHEKQDENVTWGLTFSVKVMALPEFKGQNFGLSPFPMQNP